MHTSELSRKLTTGSKFELQFSHLNVPYGFGFGAFVNAQAQHASGDEPLCLRFAKWQRRLAVRLGRLRPPRFHGAPGRGRPAKGRGRRPAFGSPPRPIGECGALAIGVRTGLGQVGKTTAKFLI